jgi:hypothetical protein
MKQLESQTNLVDNHHLNKQKDSHQFHEIGQLRRARMHAANLIEAIDSNKALTLPLQQLLEASLILETTSSKILAAHLKRPPTTIRSEFQEICAILGHKEDFRKASRSIKTRPHSL